MAMSVTVEWEDGSYLHVELRQEHSKWLGRRFDRAELENSESGPMDHDEAGRLVAGYVRSGYTRIQAYFEDTILISASEGKVLAVDALTATHHEAELTLEQLAAVLHLAVSGDDTPGNELYPVAEEAIKGWPVECRPIP